MAIVKCKEKVMGFTRLGKKIKNLVEGLGKSKPRARIGEKPRRRERENLKRANLEQGLEEKGMNKLKENLVKNRL